MRNKKFYITITIIAVVMVLTGVGYRTYTSIPKSIEFERPALVATGDTGLDEVKGTMRVTVEFVPDGEGDLMMISLGYFGTFYVPIYDLKEALIKEGDVIKGNLDGLYYGVSIDGGYLFVINKKPSLPYHEYGSAKLSEEDRQLLMAYIEKCEALKN